MTQQEKKVSTALAVPQTHPNHSIRSRSTSHGYVTHPLNPPRRESCRENDEYRRQQEGEDERTKYNENAMYKEEQAKTRALQTNKVISGEPDCSTASQDSEPLAETSETVRTDELTGSANDTSLERAQAGLGLTSALKSHNLDKPRPQKRLRITEEQMPNLEWYERPLPYGL